MEVFITTSLAFVEGLALIVSPCILPILPLILSGGLSGNRDRPYGIIVGFIIVFSLFTFFSKLLVQATGINLNIIRYISYSLLFLVGIIMMSSYLSELFLKGTQRLSKVGSQIQYLNDTEGGFKSGFLFGALVSIIWTPCAGPILAAVIVQTALQKTNLASFFVILAFAFGAAFPMLFMVIFGRTVMNAFSFFRKYSLFIRKFLGLLIITSVTYLLYSEAYGTVSEISYNPAKGTNALLNGLENSYTAPEISGIDQWINSSPLQISQLKNKVILIDFWTYSCINCIRTLPYLKHWYQKYHDKGLIIIGIHTPEFEFEKNFNNVKNAVSKFEIKYPVALDNHYRTWQNFHNQYWPAHYLINQNGKVVYIHFGEGAYAVTENNIRYLLGLKNDNQSSMQEERLSIYQTPETYLGYAREENFVNLQHINPNTVTHYSMPNKLELHQWSLQGNWNINKEKIITGPGNNILQIHFYAKKVFVVMGAGKNTANAKIVLNGETQKTIEIKDHQLYEILRFDEAKEGVLEIHVNNPAIEFYTFTFG